MTAHDLPALNAALNAACALLLLAGYAAVRGRRLRAHAALMTAALAVSAAFLTSYLYYHLAVRRGEPTRFTGTGWARTIYFSVLTSHTLLAVPVAFLAPLTAVKGYRGALDRHTRLARWTLPLWLYVSVTGVIVYWMLYHLYPAAEPLQ